MIELALTSHARAEQAERQLAWFKKQLFGQNSEKRSGPIAEVEQLSLGEGAEGETRPVEKTVSVKSYAREVSKGTKAKHEKPLRFDDAVPRIRRVILPPEIEGLDESEYEIIDERVTQHLVQTPSSYQVEEVVRPVVKLKNEDRLVTAPAEPGVLERSRADVSSLAGLLIDKFRFHMPLYRQHQRMEAAGVHLAGSTLTSWVHDTIDLLRHVYDAQLASILTSRVLAMDETPIKAGRKSKGKMKQGYFWPVYGDQDEVAFPSILTGLFLYQLLRTDLTWPLLTAFSQLLVFGLWMFGRLLMRPN